MRIVIPSENGNLCPHFGHCENFTFVEVENDKIIDIKTLIPEDGISCQSAYWISEQNVDILLAGGMGMRPMEVLKQSGINVITGCPEMPVEKLVEQYLSKTLTIGENSCSDDHHHCGSHGGHCH